MFSAEGTPPSGALVLGAFAVAAGLLIAAIVALAAAHGRGRLVDVFLLGVGLLLAYAVGLRSAPLVAVALVATYVALEGHYGRLDGSHACSVVALAIVFGAAALATGALAESFQSWDSAGPEEPAEWIPEPPAHAEDLGPADAAEADTLEALLDQAIRAHGALSLLLARPDGIERMAEDHGQHATRAVLDRVAEVLRGHLRGTDALHRHGLFDFWVILPRTSLEAARMTAERVRLAVGEGRIQTGEHDWMRASVSIGISSCPIDGRTAHRLREASERALAAAGQLGGNRTVLHSVPPGAPRGWGLAPETELPPVGAPRRSLE